MSHKKTINTIYRDKAVLTEAFRETCAQFGFTAEVGYLTAQMYSGARVPVDMCIRRNRQFTSWYYGDFGLTAQADGTFRIVIDDLDEQREPVQAFLNDLAQRYGLKSTLKDLLAQGWIVSQEAVTDAQGNIRLEMSPTRRVLEVQAAHVKTELARVAVWR